ncbi:hypothetical protein ACIBD9_15190 [Micromonospora sp. NPDC050784]
MRGTLGELTDSEIRADSTAIATGRSRGAIDRIEAGTFAFDLED